MNGKLLLFGFDTLPAILAVSAAAGPFGAEVVLAGLDTAPGPMADYAGGALGGRMIVLCGLEKQLDTLLPALSQAGAGPDCLKAVLTPHNRGWNGVMLYAELQKERRAFQKGGKV